MEILISFVRGLFMLIDNVIVYLIEWSYDLLLKLADVNVFNESVVEMFGKRIYALLGIFMLFKLSFSLINYLLNPDDFTAKDKGFGKIITNVMTVIILIVTVPTIFKYAFVLQGEILNNKVLERVILGVGTSEDTDNEDNARFISFAIFSAFYEPNKEIPAIGENCNDVYLTRISGYDPTGNFTGCAAAIKSAMGDDSEYQTVVYKFDAAVKNNSVRALYSDELANAKAGGTFLFDYKLIISSIVGGLVALIFIQFCFDISIRAVKLGFLQLIAPIPIVSYIDPKSGKDGMFKKWYKDSISTFIDIFIRLGAVFFAVFIISIVANNQMETFSSPGTPPNPLVQIFIIVGALLFAKQLPKLIENLTGMKLSGGFTLNPVKRLASAPILGKGLSTAVGGVDSMIGGKGFMSGAKKGFKSIPVTGGDGKKAFEMQNLKKRFETKNTSKESKDELERAKSIYKKGSAEVYDETTGEKRKPTTQETADRLYKNKDFKSAVVEMSRAKNMKDSISGDLSTAEYLANSGQKAITLDGTNYDLNSAESARAFAEKLKDLKVSAAKASSAFDKAKERVNEIGKVATDDLDTFKLYNKMDDAASVNKSLSDYENKQNERAAANNTTPQPVTPNNTGNSGNNPL